MRADFVGKREPKITIRLWSLLTFRHGLFKQWGICLVKNTTKPPNGLDVERIHERMRREGYEGL